MNTRVSGLCIPHPDYRFVLQWRSPFIAQIAEGDRCHSNGFAIVILDIPIHKGDAFNGAQTPSVTDLT